jgi:hypothetical protein
LSVIVGNICQISDTYVTTQLMEEDRRFLTRRTGIIRQLTNPIYRQNIKYLASDVSRRCLVATVWSLPPPEIKYDPGKHSIYSDNKLSGRLGRVTCTVNLVSA